jgi:hypothetical protein
MPVNLNEVVPGGPEAQDEGNPQKSRSQGFEKRRDARNGEEEIILFFPIRLASRIRPWLAAMERSPVMVISRPRMRKTSQAWTLPMGIIMISAAELRSLSARGSRSFPRAVTMLWRRARMPSK